MSKIEREKIFPFEHKSEMPDIGLYKQTVRIKRKTPSLVRQIIRTKAALCGGTPPINRFDAEYINALAHIAILCDPVKPTGQIDESDSDWVDDIIDDDIIYALHGKIIEYQNSFYPKKGQNTEGSDVDNQPETAVQTSPA